MTEIESTPLKTTTVPCPKCGLELDAGVPVCPNDGTTVLVTPDVGELFENKYEFLERRAAGGMGVVFKANQKALNRIVAIKVLNSQNLTETSVRRFQQEATALAKLENPNLVKVFELGVTDYGQIYSVMEFVDGKGLDEVLKERGIPSLTKILNIFIQVCEALEYVHNYGIYHRDLKPSNIMLINPYDENPKVKLVDFGIAKVLDQSEGHSLTKTGDLFGSPLYMSPEQAKGGLIDRRSDLYSLGCVMYEVLTSEPPFTGNSIIEVLMKHAGERHKPLNVVAPNHKYPNALETMLSTLLAKDPTDRYQSAEAVRAELKALSSQQKSWYNISLPGIEHSDETNRMGRAAIIFGALSVVAIAGCLIFFLFADKPIVNHKPAPTEDISTAATPLTELEGDKLAEMNKYPQKNFASTYAIMAQKNKLDLRLADPASFKFLRDRKDYQVSELRAYQIDDKAVENIPDFPLHVLDIGTSKATRKSIKRIVQFPSLVELNLKEIKLNREDCRELLKLNRINDLTLADCGLNDDCVKELARFKHLNILEIDQNPLITDIGVQYLAANHSPVYSLELDRTGITDKCGSSLAKLSDLEELTLSKTKVSNAILPQLAQLKRLRKLDLKDSKVDEEGLVTFNPFKLYRLTLRSPMSASGLAQFKKNNPHCLVLPNDESLMEHK
jgi:tRNA A-37 threonylcarbamoyl transferase component Bud32